METSKTPRRDLLNELGLEDAVVFENPNYDSAIIGYDANDSRIIYDYGRMVEHLMDTDDMSYEDAIDFIEYNTIRAIPYAGSGAPIVLNNIDDYMDYKDNKPYDFNVKKEIEACVKWTREWFETNAHGHKAVLGMSGGKDSTIAAAILAMALGKENVIGVAMPDINQSINDADKICEYLGITYMCMPIGMITKDFESLQNDDFYWSDQTKTNIPPRIRMTMLYAIAQSYNGIVINTCNLSESYIGFETIYGDLAGSMSPIKNFTATEIIAIGDDLGLPNEWVHKTPDDGLPCSKPDEEKFGFTYNELDSWIRKGIISNDDTISKINNRHIGSQFKRDIVNIPAYTPNLNIY